MNRQNRRHLLAAASVALALLATASYAADGDEPPLPPGLGEPPPATKPGDEPALPSGLGEQPAPGEPDLPSGLGEKPSPPSTAAAGKAPSQEFLKWANFAGFWEVRGGVRTQHDKYERQASVGETRLHLQFAPRVGKAVVNVTADLLYDAVIDHHTPDLERGEGFLDLREANISFSPLKFLDAKIGRQILTWGTGDLLFINDLFGKDWQAFFLGRDVDYLKAPSDAIKLSAFSGAANLDFVYVPVFDADRYITGRRVSYYSGSLGRLAGRDAIVRADRPNEWFHDDEFHARLYRNIRGYELAAYGYWGYWKSPGGMDPATGKATFPRLDVYGASVRGPLHKGIGHLEAGYYDSRDDRSGRDPFVNNSQVRLLAGYEQDLPQIARDLTVGGQYYVEWMMDHDAYRRTLPPGSPAADEVRHVVTVRLTKLLMNQNLKLGLFAYYSPSDSDVYLRPNVSYKIDDHWTVEAGGNVFFGSRRDTFFGQFANNTNAYVALRYGF